MLQCSKPFLFILGSFLAIDKLMPCGSKVNKATGQVCHPAEKNRLGKKLSNINQNEIDYCQLKTCRYLQFIRSNTGANGNRYNFDVL